MKNERLLPLFTLTFISFMFVFGLLFVRTAVHTPLRMQHPMTAVHSSATVTSVRNSAPDTKKVNINTATAEQLQLIPGIGPVLAQKIVDHREENGPFQDVSELTNVDGIGPKTLQNIFKFITVGGDYEDSGS